MTPISIFRSSLVVKSKETAQEFYNGVKSCILIPYDDKDIIRVEPGNLFSIVSKHSIKAGQAPFIPSIRDDDCSLAYSYRKYINAYLKGE